MENSCLNKAHQQQRCAEAHLRYRRFQEAIECHNQAAELLNEALGVTENPKSLESIKLQKDYHLRQKEIIAMKRDQFETYRRAVESQRHRILNVYCNNYIDSHEDESTSLQVAIYRTMEEADSLLAGLLKKGSSGNSDNESLKSFSTTDTDDRLVSLDMIDGSNSNTPVCSKHPKDDAVVIEELRILNDQLHALVYKLVNQLDASTREVDKLKERIKQLESEKNKSLTKNDNSSNNLKVVTDSSGGTSPYVFSPCSELSPDVHNVRVLPALAPLDMPNFDFSNFIKNNSHSANMGN